jgi:integrase
MAQISLGYLEGKRRRLSLYGRTRREVAEKLAERLRDHQRGVLPKTTSRVSTEQWLRTWLRQVASSVRPRTLEHYQWLVETHLIPALGHIPLVRLTPSDVEAMLGLKLREGLSPGSVHHARAVLRNALRQAERDGLIGRNAAALAKPPYVPEAELRVLRPEQVTRLLGALAGDRLEALYVTALGLGLRQGEVLGHPQTSGRFGVVSVRNGTSRHVAGNSVEDA